MVPKLERRLRSPSVVAKHPTETFMARDRTAPFECARVEIDQSVSDSLMIPLAVIVLDVFANDSPEMTFAERNHLAEAL
jgi:hypothetical protein